MAPKVYIIVLNYKGWEDTIECLESLLKSDYENFQIIVVDNASDNDSLLQLKSWAKGNLNLFLSNSNSAKEYSFPPISKPLSFEHRSNDMIVEKYSRPDSPKVIFIESKENRGYSAGNNLGIKYALNSNDADYIWILNNDTVVPSNSLRNLVKEARKSENISCKTGILGSKLLYYHAPTTIQNIGGYYFPAIAYTKNIGEGKSDRGQRNKEKVRINFVCGASLFITTRFILEVGMLSEDYFVFMEEIDWMKRAQKFNWKIKFCPESKVYHKEGMSINSGVANSKVKSKLSDYFWTRNKVLITKKYYPYFIPTVLISILLSMLIRVKRGQSARIPLLFQAIYHGLTGKMLSLDNFK